MMARWIAAVAVVLSIATFTSACGVVTPIPTDQLSLRLDRHNLVLMPPGDGPFPAVLLLHTCYGNLGHVNEWARRLQFRGYVAVVVNSMQARGLDGHFDRLAVCGGRVLPSADRARDIAISIQRLRNLPSVDQSRIGIVGFSHGGWTVLDFLGRKPESASARAATDDRAGVKSIIAVYPYCGGDVASGLEQWPRDVRVLVLLAGQDTTVGTRECEALSREQRSRGHAISVHVYPEAMHGYDINPALLYGYDQRYDEAAARDTRARIIEFLEETLTTRDQEPTAAIRMKAPLSTPEKTVYVQNSNRRLR
jgi:dienelactone hydrolase